MKTTGSRGSLLRQRRSQPLIPNPTEPAMSEPRIVPLDPPYPPEIQGEFDKIMRGASPLRLFRTVARNPRVLQRWLAGGLLDKGAISLRLRELMILRTTALCGAEYEWGVHVAAFGAKAAWTEEQVRSTVRGRAEDSCWSEQERSVLLLADELHATNGLSDQSWRRAATSFSTEQLIELVMLAGSYHAVSFMVNAFAVQHEEQAPRFPDVT
jgi:alkylhydroperoxidase family enzyme